MFGKCADKLDVEGGGGASPLILWLRPFLLSSTSHMHNGAAK